MRITDMFNRISYIDQQIRMEATGSAEEFAHKIGISRSSWFELKNVLEQELGFPIAYDKVRRTYYYKEHGRFLPPRFVKALNVEEMKNIEGGECLEIFADFSSESCFAGL